MKKQEKVQKEHIITHVYCDDCGVEIFRSMACSVARCAICGADLCDKCVAAEEDDGSDYRTVYCKSCNAINIKYEPELKILRETKDNLYVNMLNECTKARGKIEQLKSK